MADNNTKLLKTGIKCFILLSGKTMNVDKSFIDYLRKQVSKLKVVDKVEEWDFILVSCLVVSRPEIDIKAALQKLQIISDTKPAVLVVLHHTHDSECVVPDSSRSVQREKTITADFLFHEDQGLLQCTKNNESLARIINYLKKVPTTGWTLSGLLTQYTYVPSWITPWTTASLEPVEYEEIQISETPNGGNKCFILSSGKTLNIDKSLIDHLKNQVPELKVVDKVEECDFILFFCLVVSRAEIDIKAALQKLQNISDSKPAALVVLHHTFEPDCVVPDSSRSVQREKTITVDVLFHEDQGLLQCTKNTESFVRIINYLKFQVPFAGWFSSGAAQQLSKMKYKLTENLSDSDSDLVDLTEEANMTFQEPQEKNRRKPSHDETTNEPNVSVQSKNRSKGTNMAYNRTKPNDIKTGKSSLNKCFILLCGKTLNCDKQFMKILHKQVPDLTVMDKVEECDFVLVFCPVVSRAGTDIQAALQKMSNISDTKPAVLVSLHHTFDPECVVPDSSRSVQRDKTITVDVLFHEDQGLLQCTRNTESFTRIIKYLNPQLLKQKLVPSPQDSSFSVFKAVRDYFTTKMTEITDRVSGNLQKQDQQKKIKLMLLGKSNSSKIMDTIKTDGKFSLQSKVTTDTLHIWELIVEDTPVSWFSPDHVSQSSGALQDYYLLFVPVDEPTVGKKWMLKRMEEIFTKECWRNTVIIFTNTKEGQSENQDIMRDVEERGISFCCLYVHDNINRFQVSELLKKVEMKVNENQDSEIHKGIQSQITKIKKNIKDKESKHEKLQTDILEFVPRIEEVINEVNRISEILESEIEEMNNEVTAEGFKRSLQLRVNKTVREIKEKAKSLTVTLKREKSKIDKNWGVNEGGAGVDDPINLVSDLEKNINYLKSKMQKYMKENKKHVSMLEKKDRELNECRQRNTDMGERSTELKERNTMLQEKIIELERKLKDVKTVEQSITQGIGKRPGEEEQGEAMWQDCGKDEIIKKHGQDGDAQRDDKNRQSDEEQSGEEHVKRDTKNRPRGGKERQKDKLEKLRDGETAGTRVDKAELRNQDSWKFQKDGLKAEKEIQIDGGQRGKDEGCISKEKRDEDELEVLRAGQVGQTGEKEEQAERAEAQGGDGEGQRKRETPVME